MQTFLEFFSKQDPRHGSKCPHCGSFNTYGARSVERFPNRHWAYANVACSDCKNGFGFDESSGSYSIYKKKLSQVK